MKKVIFAAMLAMAFQPQMDLATGRVYGVVYSGLDAGLVVAPLVFGALMDAGQYRAVWLGVALLFALLIATALNVKRQSSAGRAAAAAAA